MQQWSLLQLIFSTGNEMAVRFDFTLRFTRKPLTLLSPAHLLNFFYTRQIMQKNSEPYKILRLIWKWICTRMWASLQLKSGAKSLPTLTRLRRPKAGVRLLKCSAMQTRLCQRSIVCAHNLRQFYRSNEKVLISQRKSSPGDHSGRASSKSSKVKAGDTVHPIKDHWPIDCIENQVWAGTTQW